MPSLMRRINTISRCALNYKSERLSGELSATHHPFVFCICANPGMSQDAIARTLCLNKSTVARALFYLEENGFVIRESDATDKRVLRVYPTEKMKSALPEIKRISAEWNALIAEGISEAQYSVFWSVLERIAERAREISTGGERL